MDPLNTLCKVRRYAVPVPVLSGVRNVKRGRVNGCQVVLLKVVEFVVVNVVGEV